MKITIELELTEQEISNLQTNSLERVINTASRMADACVSGKRSAFVVENAMTSVEDLAYVKLLATKLWDAARNAVFLTNQEPN